MAVSEIRDADQVYAAIEKAREHAQLLGKPLQLDRVAVFLGVGHEELSRLMSYDGEDADRRSIAHALKMAKQECRADLFDALSDKGNVSGYMFQGKVNHGMVDTPQSRVDLVPVVFVGTDTVLD